MRTELVQMGSAGHPGDRSRGHRHVLGSRRLLRWGRILGRQSGGIHRRRGLRQGILLLRLLWYGHGRDEHGRRSGAEPGSCSCSGHSNEHGPQRTGPDTRRERGDHPQAAGGRQFHLRDASQRRQQRPRVMSLLWHGPYQAAIRPTHELTGNGLPAFFKPNLLKRNDSMQRSRWAIFPPLAMTLAFSLAPGHARPARAQEPPKPAEEAPQTSLTPRGGSLAKTVRHQFEVLFYKTGVRIFPHDVAGKPVAVSTLTGTATFVLPGAPNPFVYPFQAAAPGTGPAPSSLALGLDLSKVPATGTKVTFQINGLADPAEPSATFTVPFVLPGPPPAPRRVVPASLSITRSTAADQTAIDAQRGCKVTGASLGSMGAPIKVTRGDRAIFLCCQSCVKRVQANPDRYLGAASAVTR